MATLQDLLVRVGADVGSFVNGMAQASASAQMFGKRMDAMGQKNMAVGRNLTMGLTLPIAGLGYKSIKAAADFEKSMNTMAAVAQVPAKEMEKLDALAVQLGQDTVFSTQEAADAMLNLTKGGITPAQIQAGALATTLDLASAADMDLAESATILSNAMNTFNLTGEDSTRIADSLAGAANASSADMGDLAYALQAGGASAARFNFSIEETSALLALLADRGIKGSDAGTLLKSQLRTLVPITDKARERMKKLGMDFFDSKGQFIGLAGMANELKDELSDLTQEQRETAIAQLFGSDASRLAGILAKEGAAGLREYMQATTDTGVASEVANAKMKGLPGSLEQLRGSIETAFLALGRSVAPTIEAIADGITGMVNAFTALDPGTQKFIAGALAITAALGPVLFILGSFQRTIGKVIGMVGTLGMAMGSTKIDNAMTDNLGDMERAASNASARLKVMATVGAIAFANFAMSIARAKMEASGFADNLGVTDDSIGELRGHIQDVTDASMNFRTRVSDAFGAILTGAPTATQQFNALRDEAQGLRDSMLDLGPAGAAIAKAKADLIDTTLDAQELASTFGKTINEMAPAQEMVRQKEIALANAMRGSAIAAAEAAAATDTLSGTREKLAGISDSVLQNEINQERATRNLAQAQKAVNQMEAEGITKGAKYKEALLNLRQAKIDVRNSSRSLSGSVKDLVNNMVGAGREGRASTHAYMTLGQQLGFSKKQLKGFVTDLPGGSRKLSDMANKLNLSSEESEALHTALEILQTGFTKTTGKAKAEFGKLPGIVSTAGADAASAAQSAGASITAGIATGIRGAIGDVIASVNSVVDAAVDAANSRAKNKSPSKVFAEVGKNMGLGMAVGMKGTTRQIQQASADMVAYAASPAIRTAGPGDGDGSSVLGGDTKIEATFVTRGKPDKKFAKESLEELEWMRRTEPFSGR